MARRRKRLGNPFKFKRARKRPYAAGSVKEKRRVAQRGIEKTVDALFLPITLLTKVGRGRKGRR